MTASLERSYPLPADVPAALSLLTGPRWVQARARELGDGSRTERREVGPDGRVVVAVSRVLPDGVPGHLAPFLPADRRVVQTDSWSPLGPDGVCTGTWRADLPGAPATVRGTLRLEPAPGGCRYVVAGEVQVRVPLVGGKAERFLVEVLGRLTDREAALLATELAAAPLG